MPGDSVITIKGLGKKYELGMTLSHDNLRDQIAHGAWSAWSRLRGRKQAAGGRREGSFWALKNVSFDVRRGEIVGIIGKNGAGKSTLLKIISEITEPTAGEVLLKGRVASLLEVGTGMHPELSGEENVYLNGAILGMSKAEIVRKYDQIVEFAGIQAFMGTPIKRYSSGMRVRLGFAIAAHLEPDILIVDEVLAVGDADFQQKCLGRMQDVADQDRTVLFVSHNMASMKRLCMRGILLKGGTVADDGEIGDVITNYLSTGLDSRQEFRFEESQHRYPSPFRIVSFRFVMPEERGLFLFGEPVRFELSISCDESLTGVRVGVGIVSEGLRLCTMHTPPLDFPASKEKRTLSCVIPERLLLPGNLSLVLGAHLDGSGRGLDYISQEVPFEISKIACNDCEPYDEKSPGIVRIEPEWHYCAAGDRQAPIK